MPTYVLPQVQVFQDFTTSPAAAARPLPAHVSGGHAFLRRYAEPEERDEVLLGYYDPAETVAYDWPQRPAGAVVDRAYAKVYVRDALLRYFEDTVGSGATITKTAGYNNRVRAATLSFATNGAYARSAAFLDRDVRKGDVAKVRGFDGDGNAITLWTTVKDLAGDPVAAVLGDAASDADNPATQGLSTSAVKLAGADNCVALTVDASGYDGLAEGDVVETYDIVVLESSLGGDYTTARLRVLSGSGHDDVASVVPAASGLPTAIGARGLTVTFAPDATAACSASATADSVSPDDLIAGQRWTVTAHQAFTKPAPTAGGTYAGTVDTTYIVEVSRGGAYGSALPPQIRVTTTNGVDLSGPTAVTAAATPTAVGTQGVTIAFSGTALRKGDRYYIAATAATVGPLRTVVLANNLSTDIAAGSEVDLSLFIRVPDLAVPRDRLGFAPLTNWDADATQITLNQGIVAYESSWTDGGVPQPLDLVSEPSRQYGRVYVEYRAWLNELAFAIGSVRDVSGLDAAISGPLDPDNPLKWGAYQALLGANGTPVKFTAVADPDDPASWADMLAILVGRDEVYGLVPLTRDRTVLDLFAAHVSAMSAPGQGLWRVLWTSLAGVPTIPVVAPGSDVPGHTAATTTDGQVCLAVIEDDPQAAGTQYTTLRCTSGNGDFVTAGVRGGDVVRALYTGDGFGNVAYTEFTVDTVVSEDQVQLRAGPSVPVSVPARIEVWRNLAADEEAAEIARNAGTWGDRRVRAVWPDRIEAGGVEMEGYFLCCNLAGLTSGVLPHQGLTRLEIAGYTAVPRTTTKFNRDQLDAMAVSGTWIVAQDPQSGQVFTRHAVTTAGYDVVAEREEMVTRNSDSISYRFGETFDPYVGVTNVTPVVRNRIEHDVLTLIDVLKTESETPDLGGQVVDGTLASLDRHPTLADRYVVELDLTLPSPLNNLDIHLAIEI